jgi:hypothetical protein
MQTLINNCTGAPTTVANLSRRDIETSYMYVVKQKVVLDQSELSSMVAVSTASIYTAADCSNLLPLSAQFIISPVLAAGRPEHDAEFRRANRYPTGR